MAQGKPLTHFQAMAMLRKALIASFIAKPKKRGSGEVEMKNTECRRLSQGKLETGAVEEVKETVGTEGVKGLECLVLKDEDQPGQAGETEVKQQENVQEVRGAGGVKRKNYILLQKSLQNTNLFHL